MVLPAEKLSLQKFRMRKVVDIHCCCFGYVDRCVLADNVRYKSLMPLMTSLYTDKPSIYCPPAIHLLLTQLLFFLTKLKAAGS